MLVPDEPTSSARLAVVGARPQPAALKKAEIDPSTVWVGDDLSEPLPALEVVVVIGPHVLELGGHPVTLVTGESGKVRVALHLAAAALARVRPTRTAPITNFFARKRHRSCAPSPPPV